MAGFSWLRKTQRLQSALLIDKVRVDRNRFLLAIFIEQGELTLRMMSTHVAEGAHCLDLD